MSERENTRVTESISVETRGPSNMSSILSALTRLQEASEVAQLLLKNVSQEAAESGKQRDNALRGALAEGLDNVMGQLERGLASTRSTLSEQIEGSLDKAEARWKERFDAVTAAIEQVVAAQKESESQLQGDLGSVDGILARARSDWQTEQTAALDRLTQSFEETIQRSFTEATQRIDQTTGEMNEKLEALRRSNEQSLAQLKDTAHNDVETISTRLHERLDGQKGLLDSWRKEQDKRLNALEEENRRLAALSESMQKSQSEMMQFLGEERSRVERVVEDQQREEARKLNNAGVARFNSGDLAQAEKLFEQAVNKDQRFAEAYNNLGLCLTEQGRHDEATVAFETAIEINPELAAGYNNLGYVLFKQQSYEAAIEMYKEAIGRSHDTSSAYTNLGNAYQKTGELEKAVTAWQKAVQIDPANDRAARYLERYSAGIAAGDISVTSKDDQPDPAEAI